MGGGGEVSAEHPEAVDEQICPRSGFRPGARTQRAFPDVAGNWPPGRVCVCGHLRELLRRKANELSVLPSSAFECLHVPSP